MRDRQPVGNIIQQEVVEATCSSAQVPARSADGNNITPDPTGIFTPTYYPSPSPSPSPVFNSFSPQQQSLCKTKWTLFFFFK